jgi:O-antigen/teichoic acid export membrane protein
MKEAPAVAPRGPAVRGFHWLRERLSSPDVAGTLASGSAAALGFKLAGTGFVALLQLLLARVLGPEGFGHYAYALSWVGILAILAGCGLDIAASRFVPAYASTGQWYLLAGFTRRAIQLSVSAAAVLAVGLAVSTILLGDRLVPSLEQTLLVASLLLPFFVLLQILASLLRSLKQILLAVAPQSALRPVVLGLGVAALYLALPRGLTASQVMALDVAVTAMLALLSLVLLRGELPAEGRQAIPAFRTRRWLATSLPLLAISSVRLTVDRLAVVLIGVFVGTTESGVYLVASQLTLLMGFGVLAVGTIAAPMIAELHAGGRTADLQRLATLGARGAFAFALATGGFLVLLGRPILGLFGNTFEAAYPALLILVAGQIVNSAAGPVGLLLAMTGHEGQAARVAAAVGGLQLVASVALIPVLGTVGAALATTFAAIVWNVLLVRRVSARLGIDPAAFGWLPRRRGA